NNRASSENPAKPDYYLMRGGDPSKTLKHREQGAEGGHPNFATRSVDYAYVSRFRNPINPEAYYFVFAGLKTAGQKALRHYFEDAELVQDFHHDDEEFEIIVRVPYIRHVRKGKALAGPEIMPNEISTLRRDLYDLSDEEERAIST
ncbi:MAG: hypothetical protein O7D34_10875, partial [Ignavibacteria bacterium]|nr:hypothetical protein [Ignavibacteria bacterium]